MNTPLQFISEDLRFSLETGSALVTSALLIGAAVGSLSAGQAADKYGPKQALQLNNILFIAGCSLTMTTPLGLTGMVAGEGSRLLPPDDALHFINICCRSMMQMNFPLACQLNA